MTPEEHIVAALDGLDGRTYPVALPQQAPLPARTYQRIYTGRWDDHGGAGDLRRVRIQVNFWANDYATAKAQAAAGEEALLDYVDPEIHRIAIEGGRDDWDPERPIQRVHFDALVTHT